MVGREKEIEILKECFQRATIHTTSQQADEAAIPDHHHRNKEVVLIGGQSGAGKSSVAVTVKNAAENTDIRSGGFIFGEGKFEMNASNKPYAGISRAFGRLCQQLKEADEESVEAIKMGLHQQLGREAELLCNLIPQLEDIMGEASDTIDTSMREDGREDNRESQLERVR